MNVENEKGLLRRPEIIQDVLDTMAAGLGGSRTRL